MKYAPRFKGRLSGDDSEETLQERLQKELQAFEEEFYTKDWSAVDIEE